MTKTFDSLLSLAVDSAELVWLYLQLWTLRAEIAGLQLLHWVSANPDGATGTACGLAGALVLAISSTRQRQALGWSLFLASNAGMIALGLRLQRPDIIVLQCGFTITSLLGLWRTAVAPLLTIKSSPSTVPETGSWFFRLFTSSIPAPVVGQVWISMHSERCIRIAEVSITDCGMLMWSEQYESRDWINPLGHQAGAIEAMGRKFNPLPDGSCFGLHIWRRQVRSNRLVLLGSEEHLRAHRIKHGRTNPPPWTPKPPMPTGFDNRDHQGSHHG